MFEELGFIALIFIVSYVFKRIAVKDELGPFRTILMVMRFLGVVVHEFSHYILCILCKVPAGNFTVKLRGEYSRRLNPHGHVTLNESVRVSLMQIFMISLAPLLISSWLIFWCIEWAFSEEIFTIYRVIAGFSAISLLLGAAPSQQDIYLIQKRFNYNRRYSLFQLILVVISSLLVFILMEIKSWEFLIRLISQTLGFLLFLAYYLMIGIIYTILKYSLLGSAWLLKVLTSRKRPGQAYKHYKAPLRNNIRPMYYEKYKETEVDF